MPESESHQIKPKFKPFDFSFFLFFFFGGGDVGVWTDHQKPANKGLEFTFNSTDFYAGCPLTKKQHSRDFLLPILGNGAC